MNRDTSEYSPSKAPETRREAEELDGVSDPRLIPGGAQPRSDAPQGMAELDREQTPRVDAGEPLIPVRHDTDGVP